MLCGKKKERSEFIKTQGETLVMPSDTMAFFTAEASISTGFAKKAKKEVPH